MSGSTGAGLRTYEVYQRQRVGESTAKVQPRSLISAAFCRDPYPILSVLRENYPCYRDWIGNSFWITRYDDVTSVFMDDANFETRPNSWFYGIDPPGRDLRDHPEVLAMRAGRTDSLLDEVVVRVVGSFASRGRADLARDFAARVPIELLVAVLGLPGAEMVPFAHRYFLMKRGRGADPRARDVGLRAMRELANDIDVRLSERRREPTDDLLSTFANLDLADGPVTAGDVVTTLLEDDHETLHGALGSLWFHVLADPQRLAAVDGDRRMTRLAYLETLRLSAPVLSAKRFARHEVERFGRLLPQGALVVCSAAAANRDPRAFDDPEAFVIGRADLCQREPRGTYRADGLPTGIAFGLGRPSVHPAVPEDRPRSAYAITRDVAMRSSQLLLEACRGLRLAPGAQPELRSLRLGEMHTVWRLPVEFSARERR